MSKKNAPKIQHTKSLSQTEQINEYENILPSKKVTSEESTDTPPQDTQDLKKLVEDIENTKKINELFVENKDLKNIQTDLSVNPTISKTANTISAINAIKDELCKLPLDTCESQFINTNITPLLTVLTQLAAVSISLSTSTYYLTLSPIKHAKKSDIKDTIDLVYNINDECEDVYHVVKKRINTVLRKKG